MFSQGGAPLWLETQNINADQAGHYSVVLGAMSANGVRAGLFTSGEARWLGVQAAGQNEQARVLLLSVPYAIKASDAETVGGLPPSAFVLATPQAASGAVLAPSPAVGNSITSTILCATLTSDGTAIGGQVGKFSGPCQMEPSEITDTGTAVGISTKTPAAKLDVNGGAIVRGATSLSGGASANGLSLPATGTATSSVGKNSFPLKFTASSFNGPSAIPVPQTFEWLAEPTGNNGSAPSGKLNLLFGTGTNAPAETGLSVSSKGIFSFAKGQTFPGAGTITGIAALRRISL